MFIIEKLIVAVMFFIMGLAFLGAIHNGQIEKKSEAIVVVSGCEYIITCAHKGNCTNVIHRKD